MPKYVVERKKDGKWTFAGMFSEKFIPQLVNACVYYASKGAKMYKTLRVKERMTDGKTTVL